VIEFPIAPLHRVVAAFARRRKSQLCVVHWSRRRVVILQVARNASRSRQAVVVIDMAVQAHPGRIRVRVGQKEPDRGMVEAGGLPGDCGVALLAGLRESARHVVGALCALVIREMACYAGSRAERVVIVDMAV
jgi:hypothetical protein